MKISKNGKLKIKRRFEERYDFYKEKSLEELQKIFDTEKLSSTDREALIYATGYRMEQEKIQKLKESLKEDKNE